MNDPNAPNAPPSETPEELVPLVYEQLKRVARARMASERVGHTLQPTALVHEVYERLVAGGRSWPNKYEFFAAAAEAMRRVLIDHARKRMRFRAGGDGTRPASRVPLVELGAVTDLAEINDPEQILRLDDAVQRLGERDSTAGEVVRLRFFAGLSIDETAACLGISARQVDRAWAFARATLFRALNEDRRGEHKDD